MTDNFKALPGSISIIKRAMEIAVAGNHSITILDCNGLNDLYYKAFADIDGDSALLQVIKPCPCGHLTDPQVECICTPISIMEYRNKKEFKADMVVASKRICIQDFSTRLNESAKEVTARIREYKQREYKIEPDAKKLLNKAYEKLNIDVMDYIQITKVASTIAGLDNSASVKVEHIAEAIQYKNNADIISKVKAV